MIKLKVSYEEDKELKYFIQLFSKQISKIKISKNKEGKYKKAYVELKEKHNE